jgi:hypothetical protein
MVAFKTDPYPDGDRREDVDRVPLEGETALEQAKAVARAARDRS